MKNVTWWKDLKCHIVNNLNLNLTQHCVTLLWVATSVNCAQLRDQLQCATLEDKFESLSLVFIRIQLVKFNMGAKRVSNQILDDVWYQINEFGFYLQEFVLSLHLHKRIFFEIPWRSNFLGQLTCTICLNLLLPPPPPPSNVVLLCTLYPVLKVFVRPNIVWRGERRAIGCIQAVREVHMMLHLHI